MTAPRTPLALPEFVVLLATMVSIVALSTDIVLPALDRIGADLEVARANDVQLVVTALFLGFGVGQFLAGPLSDSFGRKPVIYGGYAVFALGCVLSMTAEGFAAMIAGRVLQGLGAAAPRIVTVALVRDGYAGRDMARIMSVVMAVFILVPVVAPALGQGIVALAGWREMFAVLLALAVLGCGWFALRQPETLPPAARRPLSARGLAAGIAVVARERVAVGYTLATGCVFGAFLGYLSSAQQVFRAGYGTGDLFALWFAAAALSFGAASLLNARLVMRLGMRCLTRRALLVLTGLSAAFLAVVLAADGLPPFGAFMAWLVCAFGCVGFLFGNLNARAMEPLGATAGLGAALVGSVSTLISLPIGWAVGAGFDGGVTALVAGFAICGLGALAATGWAERGADPAPGRA